MPSAVVIESEQGTIGVGSKGTGDTRILAPVSNLIVGRVEGDLDQTPIESQFLEGRVQDSVEKRVP